MRVTIEELKSLTLVLLEHLEQNGPANVEIDSDFYWNINAAEKYDSIDRPKDLDIGQLSEDLDRLREIRSGEMPPVGAGLVWLSAILRRVGETANC